MMRYVLHLLAVAALAMAIPQLAQAMGPTSAPLKNQGVQTAANDPPAVTTAKPYHRHRHKSSVR